MYNDYVCVLELILYLLFWRRHTRLQFINSVLSPYFRIGVNKGSYRRDLYMLGVNERVYYGLRYVCILQL